MKNQGVDDFGLERRELQERDEARKKKIDEARDAYPKVKKSWDFGRLGTSQVMDTSRLGQTKKRKKR